MEQIIIETKKWLAEMGLTISEEKSKLKRVSESFNFLGFQCIIVKIKMLKKFVARIKPSKDSIKRIVEKTRRIIQSNKSASAYELITKLRPVTLGWANYFKYCECSRTFSKIDNIIYQQLRAWVFRRATRVGRIALREKYFPKGKSYKFKNREHKANWILNGTRKLKGNKTGTTIYLPKIGWIPSERFIKIKGDASAFDGNNIYWAKRTPRYSTLSTRVKNLLQMQDGKCKICSKTFIEGDTMEVDHIIPRFKGGKDIYLNLQLLHRECHVRKTKVDLKTKSKS
jgi:RNA-directed DNA polymerase